MPDITISYPVGFQLLTFTESTEATIESLLQRCAARFKVPTWLVCLYLGRRFHHCSVLVSMEQLKLSKRGNLFLFLQPNFVLLNHGSDVISALLMMLSDKNNESGQNFVKHCFIYLLQFIWNDGKVCMDICPLIQALLPTDVSPKYISSINLKHIKALLWKWALKKSKDKQSDFDLPEHYLNAMKRYFLHYILCNIQLVDRRLDWDWHGISLPDEDIKIPFHTVYCIEAFTCSNIIHIQMEEYPYEEKLHLSSMSDLMQCLAVLCSLTSVYIQRHYSCFLDGEKWNPFNSQEPFSYERRCVKHLFLPVYNRIHSLSLDSVKRDISISQTSSFKLNGQKYHLIRQILLDDKDTDPLKPLRIKEFEYLQAMRPTWSHPNIVGAYSAHLNGRSIHALVYEEWGRPLFLHELNDLRNFELETHISFISQIAEALDYLHRVHNYPHRRVPEGILVHFDGQAKLTDMIAGVKVPGSVYNPEDGFHSKRKCNDEYSQYSLFQMDVLHLSQVMAFLARTVKDHPLDIEKNDASRPARIQYYQELPYKYPDIPDVYTWKREYLKFNSESGGIPNRNITSQINSINDTVQSCEITTVMPEEVILIHSQLKLGEGHSARVYRGDLHSPHFPQEVTPVAVRVSLNSDQRGHQILGTLKHRNIITVYRMEPNFMVMELAMSLQNYLKKRSEPNGGDGLPVLQLLSYLEQVCEAMEYLSDQQHITHTDLALRNLLIMSDESHVKLGDFGLAYQRNRNAMTRDNEDFPIFHLPYHEINKAQVPLDIWSFGVVTWEIFMGGHGNVEVAYKQLLQSQGNPHSFHEAYARCCRQEGPRLAAPERLKRSEWPSDVENKDHWGAALWKVVMKTWKSNDKDRYPTFSKLKEDLHHVKEVAKHAADNACNF